MRVPGNRPGAHLGYFLTVVGLGGVVSTAQMAWLGGFTRLLPLTAVSALLLAWGLIRIVRVHREMKAWIAGDHPWAREDVAARMGPVLAQWTYAPDEWEAYTEREYRHRSGEALGVGVFAALIGVLAVWLRGLPARGIAAVAAAMFVVGYASWLGCARRMRRRNRRVRERTVTIGSNALLIDGKRDYLGDERCRTSSVRYLERETPPVLEITVAYPGRVLQHYTVRVPVPRGREDEARALVGHFMDGRWNSPPRRMESVG